MRLGLLDLRGRRGATARALGDGRGDERGEGDKRKASHWKSRRRARGWVGRSCWSPVGDEQGLLILLQSRGCGCDKEEDGARVDGHVPAGKSDHGERSSTL